MKTIFSLQYSQVPATCPILCLYQCINPGLRHPIIFCNVIRFYSEQFFESHPNPSWSTAHCQLYATAYSIYSQLPSILGAVSPTANWGCAMLCCQTPFYFGYIAYYDWFIVTNHSEDVLSACIISTAAYFLLFFIPRIIMKGHISHLALAIANSVF